MAKPHQRMFALIMALLFLFSTVALSAAVVYTIYQDRQENNIEGEFDDSGGAAEPPQDSNNSNIAVEGSVLKGTKLKNFNPVASVDELQYVEIVVGDGEEVKQGATVTAHYTGALAGDGTIFESSKDSGQPVTFPLANVIEGWQQGVPGMKVGGTRRLIIPANLAYGDQSPSPDIPPGSSLIFDIELISVENQ